MNTRGADRLARDRPGAIPKPGEGERCPRCHRRKPPERCAVCAPPALVLERSIDQLPLTTNCDLLIAEADSLDLGNLD